MENRPTSILNTICPGAIKTDLAKDFKSKGFIHGILVDIFQAVKSSSVEVGARYLVTSAASAEIDLGKFHIPYLTEAQFEK